MKKLLFATMALFALCLVGCENGSGIIGTGQMIRWGK